MENSNNIVLITEYFIHQNNTRNNEIQYSIKKNINNKYIDKIYLLNENNNNEHKNDKILNIQTNKRSTFKDTFEFANKLPNETIVIISNNDISFDDTLKKLKNINLNNIVICLGRRDAKNQNNIEGFTKSGVSQDSWIFKTPIKIPTECDFYFGVPGCDNHIAYLLNSIHYKLINIPWDIKAIHHHKSDIRKYVKSQKNFNNKYLKVIPKLLKDYKL